MRFASLKSSQWKIQWEKTKVNEKKSTIFYWIIKLVSNAQYVASFKLLLGKLSGTKLS